MSDVIVTVFVLLAIVPFFRLLTIISKRRNRRSASEVADLIERHIRGTEGPWDWDDFTSVPISNDELDLIRIQCIELDNVLLEGRIQHLEKIVRRLRNE